MSDFTNDIKVNDYMDFSTIGGKSPELITVLSSALDAVTQKTKYTVTTANRTIAMFHHQFSPSGVQANSNATGVTSWIYGQKE
jgi:hypothetical protein